jgi:hypothetical protein
MAGVKQNFRRLPVREKVAKAREFYAAMNGNPHFPSPTPALTVFIAGVNALEAAETDAQEGKRESRAKTMLRDDKEDALDKMVSQLFSYAEGVAGDDDQLIISAGMEPKGAGGGASDPLTASYALHATVGDQPGEMDLAWDTVSGARSYVIEMTTDPNTAGSWKQAGVSTKSKMTISDLASGTRYSFRVAAVGTSGQGPWSGLATKIAP